MLCWILVLLLLAVIPPVFFHFRLRRLPKKRSQKCAWMDDPPLVCAHGGDASKSAPNTMGAYHEALRSNVDCIEIDVSRSSDGVLFALHDRDLQRMTGNDTIKVGYLRKDEVERLDASSRLPHKRENQEVLTVEDALLLVSKSVKRVVLDAKVGPPSYEKGLAKDILSIVQKTNCGNCIIWAKNDILVRDILKQSQDVQIGYIVMRDPSTGARSKLLRMKGADVVGKVYAWTVDDEPSMQRMLYESVDAVITSRPTLLQEVLRKMKAECREGFLFW
ncbi:unnamed protein product [Spirodela intermedia]|uniref:glycerophosphodiester phosphodiesterase n=1 Tax=Spirodela intermedia TaxID=51605 RepID=A0A7I8IRL4_SPIIN|nr:unnamed protein product [Spirodela intermedia]CAA6660187.1 unnamed protein product [Spirodela intermedia]